MSSTIKYLTENPNSAYMRDDNGRFVSPYQVFSELIERVSELEKCVEYLADEIGELKNNGSVDKS